MKLKTDTDTQTDTQKKALPLGPKNSIEIILYTRRPFRARALLS